MQSEDNVSDDGKSLKKETIRELAQRHMMDENHTTSDEEMKNASVELSENVTVDEESERFFESNHNTIIPPLPGEDENNDLGEDSDNSALPNPYNVLGS